MCKFMLLSIFAILCLLHVITGAYYRADQQQVHLTASVGSYVIFNCHVDFPQRIEIPYVVEWTKDGSSIFSWYDSIATSKDPFVGRIDHLHLSVRGYGKASINLTSIRESDAGWYQCNVLFPNRTPSARNNGTWFHLSVNGGNLLAIPPVNQTVLEGDEAQFVCLAKDPELTVTWFKDGIALKEYQDLLKRTYLTEENALVISSTDMADLGEYQCEVSNSDGEAQTAKAYLNVQYKAKVIFAPPEIHLPFGHPAIIDCHFRANPPLTNLRWEKDGFLFDPYNIQGVFYRRNGSLFFTQVDDSHNGRYTCTPYNELGTQGPSPPIQVIVQKPPVFVITPHNIYLRKLGDNIQMSCDAQDDDHGHKPTIVWYKKDGTSLPMGRYAISNGNLTIFNIHEQDQGLYQCSASNKAATITVETELFVENIPSNGPHNLTAASSSTSVHLSWIAGQKPNVNCNYSVWYKPSDQTEWKTIQLHSSRTLELTITDLQHSQWYDFMVLCKDESGDGLFSKSIMVQTRPEPNVNALPEARQQATSNVIDEDSLRKPHNVSVTLTDSGYMVSWLPPIRDEHFVKAYVVQWLEQPGRYLIGSSEVTSTQFMLHSLKDGMEYDVNVVSVTFDGLQAISPSVRFVAATKRIPTSSIASPIIIITLILLAIAFFVAVVIKGKWCNAYTHSLK